MTYPNREVYKKAPLAIVTAEVRLNYEPRLNNENTKDLFADKVRSHFPVLERGTVNSVTFQEGEEPQTESVAQIRATTLDQTALTTLTQTSLNVSMAGDAYSGFESFVPLIDAAVLALSQVVDSVVVQRVGLRYIDEVRVATPPDNTDDWQPWINKSLLAPVNAYRAAAAEFLRGTTVYDAGEGRKVIFNWGEFIGSTVVGPDLPFHKADLPSTKMFLIDVDSAWEPPQFALLDPEEIRNIVRSLHDPIGEIFQWSITDEARNIFRGNESDGHENSNSIAG